MILRYTLTLAVVAALAAGLISITHQATLSRIQAQQERLALENLQQLLKADEFDNALTHDCVMVTDEKQLGTPKSVTIYRAHKQGQAVAALFRTQAPDGYGGPIQLLIGIYQDGSIAGVRAEQHRETPGLGDNIDLRKSLWVFHFNGKSLENPPEQRWAVRKDGGDFDGLTGATITPRAVIKAVKQTLLYFSTHKAQIFDAPNQCAFDDVG